MTEADKIRKMINAFDALTEEYRKSGNFVYANTVNSAMLDLPNSSLVRLYDLLQKAPA